MSATLSRGRIRSLHSTTTILTNPQTTPTLVILNMSTLSTSFSPLMRALWRIVRMLFGLSASTSDAENGEVFEVNFPAKSRQLALTDPIATFKPDIAGIPALTLSSMALGAAFAPAGPMAIQSSRYPNARIPVIVITPPPDEQQQGNGHLDPPSSFDLDTRRAALKTITNQPKRVYGKSVRPQRASAKGRENLREHPNTSRLTHRQVLSPPAAVVLTAASHKSTVLDVAEPGSTEWEKEKASQLSRAKSWSEQVKARRQSLPATSPTPTPAPAVVTNKHMSAPARLPLSERLSRLVTAAGCASPPAAVVAPPLWGDSNVSFVIDDDEDNDKGSFSVLPTFASLKVSFSPSSSISGSSSGGSISSLLDAFEENLRSSLWRGLEDFGAVLEEGGRFEN
ncbi:hypothetical protein R3P38DRAFT_3593517 [Favolaschia claudopus]|uniref:Uncharacterized protein n=1 Tax=Favolaschia claudopus TaxID=2862362 RepID=A0AAW0AGA8_9AGAR